MKNILNFLVEAEKLKEIPRKGWVLRGVKNPESIASHTFRTTIMAWLLEGKRSNFKESEKVIKTSLIHDLCEIYAGDTTPYDSLILEEGDNKKREIMKTWPRLSLEEKQRNFKKKRKKERESLKELISDLPSDLRIKILNFWMDYEEKTNEESDFFSQIDRIESLVQAHEYWEKDPSFPINSWWEWANEFFYDPISLDLMEVLKIKFHNKKSDKKTEEVLNLLNFFISLSVLKTKKLERANKEEVIAEYNYSLALLVWILSYGVEDLDTGKALKISLLNKVEEVLDSSEEEVNNCFDSLPRKIKKELKSIRKEKEEMKTKESKFVKKVIDILNTFQKEREDKEEFTETLEKMNEISKNNK